MIRNVLAETGLPAQYLELEVTEGIARQFVTFEELANGSQLQGFREP